MRAILDRLAAARGVKAAAVFDADGTLLDASGEATARAKLMGCLAAMRSAFGDRTSVVARTSYATVARFEEGTLIVRCAPHAILVVLADRDVDLSPLATGFHVMVALKAISIRAGSRRPGRYSEVVNNAQAGGADADDLAPSSARLRPPAVPKI